MPRFVILFHETPSGYERPSHWDLMLEWTTFLRTWALYEQPEPGRSQDAEALDDHRLAYLTFEGAVSGGRGTVVRWDEGTYKLLEENASRIRVELAGCRIRTRVEIEQCENRLAVISFQANTPS